MKKWIYVIIPGALLGIFLIFYSQEVKRLDTLQHEREAAAAQQKAQDDEKKHMLQQKAKEESDRRAAETAAANAAKEAEKVAAWNAAGQKIKDDIAKANADTAETSNKAKALQAELDALQEKKERDIREEFDLTKRVELARVNQHNADLESQRMVDMIANRASQTAMAQAPQAPQAQ